MDFSTDIEKCVGVLKGGALILYPTDTIWGIGCDATNEKAIDRIFQLKKRPASKSMIILVAEERDVLQFVAGPISGSSIICNQLKDQPLLFMIPLSVCHQTLLMTMAALQSESLRIHFAEI